jgi:hypothetical protein
MPDPDLSRRAAKLKDRAAILKWALTDGDETTLGAAVEEAEKQADLDWDGKIDLIEEITAD